MPNLASVTIHNVKIEFDVEKLNPESLKNMAVTAVTRRLSLGAKTKSTDELTKLSAEMAIDPNPFFMSTRGTGVSRPKLDMFERKAKSWFSAEFLPALKLAVDAAVKLWTKAGGSGLLLSAPKEATEEQKAAAGQNQTARDKLIAAKAKKLKDSGWEPEMI